MLFFDEVIKFSFSSYLILQSDFYRVKGLVILHMNIYLVLIHDKDIFSVYTDGLPLNAVVSGSGSITVTEITEPISSAHQPPITITAAPITISPVPAHTIAISPPSHSMASSSLHHHQPLAQAVSVIKECKSEQNKIR